MLLSVEDLRVSYDNIKALHGLSFRIDEGEIVCIIGANGAGKSTTLRAISRLVPVEAGTKMTLQGHGTCSNTPPTRWSANSASPTSRKEGGCSTT